MSHGLPKPEAALPAAPVRQAVNDPGEPFLGSGLVSPKFFDLSEIEAQGLFYAKVSHATYNCTDVMHIKPIPKLLGSAHEICADNHFNPQPGACLVYSFGINDEWNFEDGVNKTYGCEIHSFDPRPNFAKSSPMEHLNVPNMIYHNMGVWGWNFNTEGGWELRDLLTIVTTLNHQNRIIDVVKLDIEGAEWQVLRHLVDSGLFRIIKQITMEMHAPRVRLNPITGKEDTVSVLDLAEMWQTLHDLERAGFEMFSTRTKSCCETYAILKTNPFLAFGDKPKCCFKVVYVNTRLGLQAAAPAPAAAPAAPQMAALGAAIPPAAPIGAGV